MKKTIIINGCDKNFYSYMVESLDSLVDLKLHEKAAIGILDLGLDFTQAQELKNKGYYVVKPTWTMSVPESIRKQHQLGLIARTDLRDYFPGYDVYLWFDADAWAQTPEFFYELTEGASNRGAALISENGPGYRKDFAYAKWWYGNMVASYGLMKGLYVASQPVFNIGIMALASNAPHWDVWKRYYQEFINTREKVNNQHSFNAAVRLENLDFHLAPARCNWITVLSDPTWNPETRMLCEPNKGSKPLSVIHMAGPNKSKIYNLRQTSGGMHMTSLTYKAIITNNSVSVKSQIENS